MMPNLGGTDYDLYRAVRAFNLEFFRNPMQLKISDDIVLLAYETGYKTRPFGQQNDQKLK